MYRKGLALLLAFLLVFLTACSGGSGSGSGSSGGSSGTSSGSSSSSGSSGGSPAQSQEVKTFKVVGNLATLRLESAKMFAQLVEERSGGKLKPELYLEGQLGTNDEDLTTSIAEGSFEVYFAQDMLANWVAPDWLGYANVAFAFRGPDHVKAFWNSEIGEEINQKAIEAHGVRLLLDGVGLRGARHLTANKPIKSVAEMKGIKIRVPNVAAVVDSWEATGAIVTPIPWGELFGALQTGVVDAQENPFEQIDQGGLYQVQKYIMLTHHQYGVYLTHVNEKWWQSLTDEEREIIRQANKDAADYFNTELPKVDAQLLEKFKAAGVTVVETSEIDIQSFKDAIVGTVLEKNKKEWAEGGWEKIQSLQ